MFVVGNRDTAIKKRVMGTDDLSGKYLGQIKSQSKAIAPPDDESITTLWVGNIEGIICEQDLFDAFYSYGRVLGINIVRPNRCAFVEYADRASAEAAASVLYNSLLIKGHSLSLNWSKPRAPREGNGDVTRGGDAAGLMPAPPGMETAPMSAYALPPLPLSGAPPPPPGLPPAANSNSNSNSSCNTDNIGSGVVERPHQKRQRMDPGAEPGHIQPPSLHYRSMDPERLGAVSK